MKINDICHFKQLLLVKVTRLHVQRKSQKVKEMNFGLQLENLNAVLFISQYTVSF